VRKDNHLKPINPSKNSPIGILGALPEETEPFLEELEGDRSQQEGRFRFHRGCYKGQEAVVVCSGTGKVNAVVASQLLIDRFGVKSLLMSGIGGSLYPDARPGDAIIGTELIHHDVGFLYGKEEFISCGVRVLPLPEETDSSPHRVPVFHSDEGWVTAAHQAGEELRETGFAVHSGPIVTGECVVFSSEKKQWLRETFGALAVEMEGAAVAQTAYLNGLPFLVVRAVSDSSDERAVKGRETVEKLARAVHPGKVVQDDSVLRERLSLAARNASLLVKKTIEQYGLPQEAF